MKIRCLLFRGLLAPALAAGLFVSTAWASDDPTTRVVVPNTTINGQPVRLLLDTGSDSTLLENRGARRLRLKTAPPVPEIKLNGAGTDSMALSEPLQMTVGAQTFNVQVPVHTAPRAIRWFYDVDGDGLIGWSEIKDNILVFDAARRTISSVEKPVAETAGWLKLKVLKDNVLLLQTPMPDGKTGSILVDTGNAMGVSLPPEKWKEWRAAHPKAPSTNRDYSMPGIGALKSEDAWADEITLGALKLTDVPVMETPDDEVTEFDDFVGAIGMYALARMDLVVDGKNGYAYLRPKPAPGPPYPGIERPGVTMAAASQPDVNADWTVADNVRLNADGFFLQSAVYKSAALDFDGAIADLDQALTLNPENADAYIGRAGAKEGKNDHDGAITDFTHAIEIAPDDADAYTERASVKAEKNATDDAIADYNKALDLDPKNTDAFSGRGSAKGAKGDFDGAMADYNRVIELDPKNADAFSGRGFVEVQQSDYPGAIADYNHALELDPKSTDAFSGRGLAHQNQGDFAEAIADNEKALDATPANQSGENNSLYLHIYDYLLQRRLGMAQSDFAKTVAAWKEGWPKSVGQFLTGGLDETSLLAAAEKEGEEPVVGQKCEAYYYIGLMHLLKGDQAGARDFFQKSVAMDVMGYYEYQLSRVELARLNAPASK